MFVYLLTEIVPVFEDILIVKIDDRVEGVNVGLYGILCFFDVGVEGRNEVSRHQSDHWRQLELNRKALTL